jgi:hypothetical protein
VPIATPPTFSSLSLLRLQRVKVEIMVTALSPIKIENKWNSGNLNNVGRVTENIRKEKLFMK